MTEIPEFNPYKRVSDRVHAIHNASTAMIQTQKIIAKTFSETGSKEMDGRYEEIRKYAEEVNRLSSELIEASSKAEGA